MKGLTEMQDIIAFQGCVVCGSDHKFGSQDSLVLLLSNVLTHCHWLTLGKSCHFSVPLFLHL